MNPIPGRPTAINRRADVTPEERAARAEIARTMNSLRESFKGGRPRSEDRCPCGRFTRLYATAYGHKCQAPAVAPDGGDNATQV